MHLPKRRSWLLVFVLQLQLQQSSSQSFHVQPPPDDMRREAAATTDIDSIPVQTFVRDFGSNVSIPCPEVREEKDTFQVHQLEWYCRGCGSQRQRSEEQQQHQQQHQQETAIKLVSFGSQGTVIHKAPERINLSTANFSLQISPSRSSDSGDFFCLVNDQRQPSLVSRLVVQAPPDPPGKPLIMAFTSRSVNLSWTPPLNSHNAPVSHYLINIRVGEDGSWDEGDDSLLETQDNQTSIRVKDLEPFTTYSFRVTAVNAMGRSSYSKESYYMLTLREVPSGKPTITAAHNTSSTSLQLSWRPPHPSTIHGEFLGYRVAFKPRNAVGADAVKEVRIKDPMVAKYTIQKLDIFTQYLVSLQVYNPEGLGPSTTVVVMTDEGIPSMPVNVSMREVSNSSVRVLWHRPSHPNGIIQGYRMYFMHQNFTDVRTVRDPQEKMEYLLEGLDSFTKYKIWLKAFTWKNEGEPSQPFEMVTDVAGPSAPIITNLTCKDEQSIYLQWDKPSVVYKAIDFYYIYYRNEEQWQFKEVAVGMNGTKLRGSKILLEGLKTDSVHEVKVRGATRSIYDASKVYKGDFSDAQSILLKLNCDQVHAYTMVRSSSSDVALDLSAGMIAGVACVAFSIILALLALGLWRKFFNESYYYLDESPATPAPSIVPDWDAEAVSAASPAEGKLTAIPAHLYIQRIAALHADGDIGFSKEFEAIQAMTMMEEFQASGSHQTDNKHKNRYPNVVAYDHTRVQLRALPGQKRGEYVNANYIDGFQKSRAYIATQGPLPATFDSFWRMIWEQKVRVVVMITNLVEMGKRKCDMYWPAKGTEKFGLIEVTFVREEVMSTYTVRTFVVRHTRIKGSGGKAVVNASAERYVMQYQFTTWPDYGVPENPLPLLSFVRRSSDANRDTDAPVVVHCSAGVGRTGAYILIDAMLKQMRAKGELNLVAYLRHIRTQRNYLVQTEEQYIFVHDALAEAVASGETNIHRSYLSRYINSLQSSFTTDENSIPWQLLDRQFKLATAYQPQEAQFMAALNPCNQSKNQNFDYLPIESARVAISAKPGLEGSDYVNASWLPGFNNLREFIITQHPMEQTVLDFWQLLWDHEVRIVVVLSPLQQPEFGIFWPDQTIDLDVNSSVRVRLSSESEHAGYQTKDFILQSLHDEDNSELSVRLLFCPGWPYHLCSQQQQQLSSVTDLPGIVQSLQQQQQHSGPVVVMDRFGGTEAATFCAVLSLVKQLEFETHVDVYEYAKMSHLRRPGIWRTQNEYFFLYRVLDSICSSGFSSSSSSGSSPYEESSFQTFLPALVHHHHHHHFLQQQQQQQQQGATVIRIPPDGRETLLRPSDVYQRY